MLASVQGSLQQINTKNAALEMQFSFYVCAFNKWKILHKKQINDSNIVVNASSREWNHINRETERPKKL